MKPKVPFKANDFANLLSPKLSPPVIPANGNINPIVSSGTNHTYLYVGIGILIVVFICGTFYMIDQNNKIMKGIAQLGESKGGIMPAAISNSKPVKPNDKGGSNEDNTPNKPSA